MAKQIKGARLSEAERKSRFLATRARKAARHPQGDPKPKGVSFFYDTHAEPLKPCKGARANVSLTMASPVLWRLPIDTTDRDHIEQGVSLLTA